MLTAIWHHPDQLGAHTTRPDPTPHGTTTPTLTNPTGSAHGTPTAAHATPHPCVRHQERFEELFRESRRALDKTIDNL